MGLETIAHEMHQKLDSVEKGFVSRALFGGLVIVYERRHTWWRLAIGREKGPPSKTETDVIARDFGVPAGVEWSWLVKPRKTKQRNGQTSSRGILVWHVAEAVWIERELSDENDCDCKQQGGLRQDR